MRKLDELPSHINKDDLYRSLYLTANTRQLYGSDRKGIPYFGTFYEKVTGVKFENTPLGINWTDEEIWTVSEAQKDNTQISTISPS